MPKWTTVSCSLTSDQKSDLIRIAGEQNKNCNEILRDLILSFLNSNDNIPIKPKVERITKETEKSNVTPGSTIELREDDRELFRKYNN